MDTQSKRCFKCLKTLPLEAFYKHSQMGDGHLNKCKECTKTDCRQHRLENIQHYRQYDRMRASLPHRVAARMDYAQTDAGKLAHNRATRKYVVSHAKRRHAHVTVGNAIRDGRLKPWPVCAVPICERQDVHAHHPDYDSPLDVVWLCPAHHRQAHALVKEAA